MLTVGDFKTKVTGKLRGASLSKVNDIYGKFREAASTMMARIDIDTTIKSYTILDAIHQGIYTYTAPSDIKGISKVIDLRPISNRNFYDSQNTTYSKDFDIRREYNSCAVEVINGVKTLKLSKKVLGSVEVAPLDALSGGFTVTGNADVTNLDVNSQDYISGNGAISFDIGGAGQAKLYIQATSTIDLSDLDPVGAFFHWFKIPDASVLTNVKLRYGTNSSNYWTQTATAPHDRSAFVSNAWLLNRYNWSTAVQTGTPDATALDYYEIEFNYTGAAQVGVLVNFLTASIGKAYDLIYYSDCLFKGVDGTWKQTPTLDTDIVMCNIEAENIFLYELSKVFAFEVKGKGFARDMQEYEKSLDGFGKKIGLYEIYTDNNPSQAIQAYTTYSNHTDLGDDTVGSYQNEQDWQDNNLY